MNKRHFHLIFPAKDYQVLEKLKIEDNKRKPGRFSLNSLICQAIKNYIGIRTSTKLKANSDNGRK